jgi:hypothetical protein
LPELPADVARVLDDCSISTTCAHPPLERLLTELDRARAAIARGRVERAA